jgi:hypothetical protein
MAAMVDVGLIEVNSRTLKRIEDNDEASEGGVDSESLRAAALYPIWIRCVTHQDSYYFG